jgi:transcriptional regulator with XRE-family HTH domain
VSRGRARAARVREEPAGAARPDGGPDPSVGARLRERRAQLGLSLRELARRLDVSPSLVSQIETGKIQPSVRTLYAMVSELGLSLDEIFELSGAPAPARGARETASAEARGESEQEGAGAPPPVSSAARVQRAHDRRALELQSGVRWERLTAWNDRDIEFLLAIYEVGGASSSDGKLVRHSGREFGLVLSGSLGVTVGFDEYLLEPGDSISFESTVPHRLHNDGDEVVQAIWVTLGRYLSAGETDVSPASPTGGLRGVPSPPLARP